MVSVVSVGIDCWREYSLDQPRQMGLDEFELTGEQLILG
jgi:hypothetical protein